MDKNIRNTLIVGSIVSVIGVASILYRYNKKISSKYTNEDNNNTSNSENIVISDKNAIKIGDNLYPSGSSVNIRNYAVVDNGYVNNIIKENHTGLIGSVDSIEIGSEDGFVWYKVKLAKPFSAVYYDDRNKIPTLWNFTYGYVRSDVVKKG